MREKTSKLQNGPFLIFFFNFWWAIDCLINSYRVSFHQALATLCTGYATTDLELAVISYHHQGWTQSRDIPNMRKFLLSIGIEPGWTMCTRVKGVNHVPLLKNLNGILFPLCF